ncbi:MAG: CNNM domain-containing protein [Eubacteriales bacterium]
MTDDSIPRCILFILLILAWGLFSGVETAFVYYNRTRMKTLAGEGNVREKRAAVSIDKYEMTNITLFIVISVTAIAVSAIHAISLLGPAGSVAATIVMTLFVFLTGETNLNRKEGSHPNVFH